MLKAEARAALMAIQYCKSLGFSKIHLEGDSQRVIDAINSRDPDWSSMGILVEDISMSYSHFNNGKCRLFVERVTKRHIL